ncbi:branched-chain amino acid transaminase [Candidatus Bathyarchaeota archaeon]|nr:branched-chain amino acid transaminase [Candidatus Bathyarchaeota archaeon]
MAIKEVEYVWMDGNFVKWNEATVHILTHALHYGTGVFEGIRGYAGANNVYIFRLREHMKRLRNSAKVYMMDIPYSQDDLCTATIELLKKNNIRETCYIRPLVYRGFGVIGLNPINSPVKTAIAAFPFGKYLGTGGVNCCVSSWRRISSSALPPEAKACGNYINSVLAKLEAIQNGFDEAILLDQYGYVSEGSGENIFIVRDNVIYTPPLSSSILEGITRDSVFKIASDLGYQVVERMITRTELYICDEAFFSGTAAEITPIVKIDHRVIGDGKIGSVTEKIRTAFFRIVEGKNEKYQHWLTPVY